MRRRWVGVVALGIVCTGAALAEAVEIGGTTEIGVDLLPTLGTYVELEVSGSSETWSVVSETEISVTPSFEGSEDLEAELDLDFAQLEVEAEASLATFDLETVDAYVSVDLFKWEILEEDPEAKLSSDLMIGAVFEEAVDPYVGLYTHLRYGDQKLSNTTTLSLPSLDVASELEGDLDLGRFELGESGGTVKVYGDVSTDLIPLEFSRARLNVKFSVDEGSILNRVTYYGGESFVCKTKVTLELSTMEIAMWGSYDSKSSTPFGFGIGVSVPWTLLE